MNTYSQNKEDLQIQEYFGDRTGTLLSVGENDGRTFSNALLLIQNNWEAHCFEPSSVCADLIRLHKGNDKVHIYNKGLGDEVKTVTFYESASHVKNGTDRALVSTTSYDETVRWRKKGVQFVKKDIQIVDFIGWYEHAGRPKLDFISIDCEGMEWEILQQIDLAVTRTEFLIIEWNGERSLRHMYTKHCEKFGLTEFGRNSENLLFCIPKKNRSEPQNPPKKGWQEFG